MEIDTLYERMSPIFEKWHLDGLPFAASLHHFTAPDDGYAHDHPWSFHSYVLSGGYTERVYELRTGNYHEVSRQEGDAFHVEPTHIHRIVALKDDMPCWTIIVPGPAVQKPGFYKWEDRRVFHRYWDAPEFTDVSHRYRVKR